MPELEDRIGRALGDRYRIEREIGRGGAGLVYLAEDLKLGRKVALKVLRPDFTPTLGGERFLREIRIAAQLNHPNILSLIDSGEADGLLYYVMFHVTGGSLRDRLQREKQLPVDDALRIAMEVAEALGHAHAAGVVHRDIKPENILFEAGHAVVSDFGIARALSEAGGDRLTETGLAIGTPAYMSPEQALGAEDVDARSDLYSLGCVLFEMLAGSPPHTGVTAQAVLARKAIEPAPGIRVIRDAVPPGTEAALAKALARVPADRFATAAQFAAALSDEGFAHDRRVHPMPGRGRWYATLAAVGGLVALVWLVRAVREGRSPEPLRASFRQLTAQPGVEDSPSLSPDGQWVVYAGEGPGSRDIFLQLVGGQRTINLTEDWPADDTQPVFSPDGERIAFRSSREGGGLFVMGRTGEAARRVTSAGFNPAWSPDGTQLVYATESVGLLPLNWESISELWIVRLDGGEARRVTDSDGVQPSWSPNGHRIAYAARMAREFRMDIWTTAPDGSDPAPVTSDAAADWSPTWSADGRHVYFASDRGGSMNLWRIAVDEKTGRALGEPEPVTTPSPFVAHPSLSVDGRLIAYSHVLMSQNIQIASFDPATEVLGDPVWLTSGSRQWSSPDITRDGEQVVFYSRDLPEGDLWVIRSNGVGLRALTSDTALDRMPRWSPDGSQVAYFSNRSGPLQLWAIRADGSDNRQLTFGDPAAWGVWSPAGSRIAANLIPEGQPVHTFDPHQPRDGRDPVPLPPPDSSIGPFRVNSWSSDGGALAGFVGPLSDDGIVLYRLGTGTYARLTEFGQWPVWLPDGRRLLFVTAGSEFHVLDTRTGEVRRVYSVARDVLGPPSITGDGRRVVFSRRVTEADIWLVTLR